MKNDYQFYVSRKITVWVKEKHIIEAESKEQAIALMKEDFEYDNEETFIEQETEYGTETNLHPEDNDGYATKELYYDEEETELIAHNGTKEYQFSNNTKNN